MYLFWKMRCDELSQFSCSVVSDSLRPHGLRYAKPPCPSPASGVYSNLRPLSRWCHPTISSSVIPLSCLQSCPALGSFQVSQFFTRWPEYWSFSFNISPSMNIQDWWWTGLIALQSKGLKSLLQHHSSKASILRCSAFLMVRLSHPYKTTGKSIALARWTLVGKVMSLLFYMLSRLVIAFLPRSKCS